MKMKRHYHVYANVAGYMPDSDSVYYATSKKEAGQIATSIAQEYREDGYRLHGNQRDGYVCERTDSRWALDTYISIAECCEECDD